MPSNRFLFSRIPPNQLDITGTAMIAIQKITLLGFSLHDGMGREYSSLLDTEKRVAIKRKPTFIEYFSFVLTFQTFLSGPTSKWACSLLGFAEFWPNFRL